jgi:23S rRNA-/tRNA-specific pseudouridylate synthase
MKSTMEGYPKSIQGCDARYDRQFEIRILFMDQNLLIVEKPHNLRVDGPTDTSPTLESHLTQVFGTDDQGNKRPLYLLHQLDYVTSGIHCWGLGKWAAGVMYFVFSCSMQ